MTIIDWLTVVGIGGAVNCGICAYFNVHIKWAPVVLSAWLLVFALGLVVMK